MFNLNKTTLYSAFIISFSFYTAVRCMESELGTLSGYEGDTETLNTNGKSANRVQPKSPELKIPAVVYAYYAKTPSSRPASKTPTKTSSLQKNSQDKNTHSFQPITTQTTPAIVRIQSEGSLVKKIPAITRVMSETNMPSCCTFKVQRRPATASPTVSPLANITLANTYDSSDSDPDCDYEQSSLTENKK